MEGSLIFRSCFRFFFPILKHIGTEWPIRWNPGSNWTVFNSQSFQKKYVWILHTFVYLGNPQVLTSELFMPTYKAGVNLFF